MAPKRSKGEATWIMGIWLIYIGEMMPVGEMTSVQALCVQHVVDLHYL